MPLGKARRLQALMDSAVDLHIRLPRVKLPRERSVGHFLVDGQDISMNVDREVEYISAVACHSLDGAYLLFGEPDCYIDTTYVVPAEPDDPTCRRCYAQIQRLVNGKVLTPAS